MTGLHRRQSLGAFVTLLDDNPGAMLARFPAAGRCCWTGRRAMPCIMLTAAHQTKFYDRAADAQFIDGLREDYRHLFLGNQIGAPALSSTAGAVR